MNTVDIIILLALLMGGVTGAKNGFFKQSVILVGTIIIFILAWTFKNIIANFLSFTFPFFTFAGPLKGLTALNIVLYQLIGFLVLLALLSAILIVLSKITGVFEKILKFTIILGIPSKILGFIVGLLEAYVIIFVVLFFLNQPAFNLDIMKNSNYSKVIVNSSPGLSNIVENTNEAIKDTYSLISSYQDGKNNKELNNQIIDTLLKHKVIDKDYLNKLKDKGKI